MSRYKIESKNKNYELIVGWDAPLCTYFFTVYDKRLEGSDYDVVDWKGKSFYEIQSLKDLVAKVSKWGEIPDNIKNQLFCEQPETKSVLGEQITKPFATIIKEKLKKIEDVVSGKIDSIGNPLKKNHNLEYGVFDPTLFGIEINQSIPENLSLFFKDHNVPNLDFIKENFDTLSNSDKNHLIYFATTGTHELKHFHDIIGTTFGYHYYSRKLAIEMQLVSLIHSVSQNMNLKTPLIKWTEHSDCPSELIYYFDSYGFDHLRQESLFYSDPFPGDYRNKSGLIIPMKFPMEFGSKKLNIYVANVGYEHFRVLGHEHIYYPINALMLLEGAAYNMQRVQISDFFGMDASNLFMEMNRKDIFRGINWYYSLSTMLIAAVVQKFNIIPGEYLLQVIHDFAFMGDFKDENSPLKNDPSYRFSNFLIHLMDNVPSKTLNEEDIYYLLLEFIDKNLNQKPYEQILQQEYNDVHTLCVVMGSDSGFKNIQKNLFITVQQHAIVRISENYRNMLNCRLNSPSLFYDPWEYLRHSSDLLPFPPNYMENTYGRQIHYGNIFDYVKVASSQDILLLSDNKFWALYHCISSILRDLVLVGLIICPVVRNSNYCPHKSRECESESIFKHSKTKCIFSSAITALNLDDVEINAL